MKGIVNSRLLLIVIMIENKCSLINLLTAYRNSFGSNVHETELRKLEKLYYSWVGEPSVLPQRPPQGWVEFIEEIGGLPWHGALNNDLL